MLKRPPRVEDDHEDSLVLLKNVGNSSFQVATLVNAIAEGERGGYPLRSLMGMINEGWDVWVLGVVEDDKGDDRETL
ncbi:hypothetical protein CMV_005929 [Castanea mollissima]|uniref:Uncharacterized protein n=1 Tax=Castanea mollissima TaxID=60419 RepID=A0A8J4VU27_9ROSI|nr:hypothetical protein CMV_005929 [Castanea mollissima]